MTSVGYRGRLVFPICAHTLVEGNDVILLYSCNWNVFRGDHLRLYSCQKITTV